MEQQKKPPKEQNKLIAQGNSLVEGKYNYSLWELRVFIEMVQSIERDDKEFKPVRIYLKDLATQHDTKSHDNYRKITLAAVRLIRKAVKIEYTTDDGEERLFHSPLVIGVDTPKRMDDGFDKYIELQFPEKIRPLLLDLKKNYLLYDKQNILNLKSKFSVRIYQILKSHEREAKDVAIVEYEVSELRVILLVDDDGNPTNQYKQYGQFEEKVILRAQKDLQEHTDIAFRFDKIKRGRRVHTIRFYIRKNRKTKSQNAKRKTPTKPTPESQLVETKQSEALQALIKTGIEVEKSLSLIRALGEELALEELKYAQKALKNAYNVKSETGFIITMMEKQSYTKSQAVKKAEQEAKKRKVALHKAQVALQKKQIAELRKEYTTERNKAIKILLKDLDKVQVAELVKEHTKTKPHIQKAIKQAEKKGNTKEANDFKYGLFVNDLTDEHLYSFDKYIERMYEFKISHKGNDEFLVAIEPSQA